jgi:hypothetical protein
MKGLPHHDARHGTVQMVDASDEDGSSLSFNSGGALASSQRPPSSWRPPLGLAMISLECPSPRVSLVVDSLFLGGFEGLDGVSGEWRPFSAIRVHELNTEERGSQTDTRTVGPVRLGRLAWALLGSVSAQFAPWSTSCTLDHWPLQLWALDVVISAIKLRDLYALTSSLFISVLRSSPFKHIGPCHLWRQVHTWSELLDCLAKRSPN